MWGALGGSSVIDKWGPRRVNGRAPWPNPKEVRFDMSDDTRDTHPTPPPGEMLDAMADDLETAIETARVVVHNLENLASALRREAAHTRGEP